VGQFWCSNKGLCLTTHPERCQVQVEPAVQVPAGICSALF
jgi:hypothetical protein